MAIIIKRKAASPPPEPVVQQEQVRALPNPLDSMCRSILETAPNAAISWWLIASYTYYHHDISVLSDGFYDELAKAMLEAWSELEHDHKHLITKEHLRAGSLYDLAAASYPMRVRGAASQLLGTAGIRIDIRH